MNQYVLVALLSLAFLSACNQQKTSTDQKAASLDVVFQNKAHEIVYNMVQKVGNYDQLRGLHDVSYTYTYTTPDGKRDVSTEKYVFDGELSYALYTQHDRSFANLEGPFEQGYDGEAIWLKHNNAYLSDSTLLKRALFNRKTNFYWFAMMQKLTGPGLQYEYIRLDTLEEQIYDVINITFTSEDNKPTDIYQVFVNQESSLVDQFLFTVADYGVMDTPLLMKVSYTDVAGILIPADRKYARSNWKAQEPENPWIIVNWSNIQFDQGLQKTLFTKK